MFLVLLAFLKLLFLVVSSPFLFTETFVSLCFAFPPQSGAEAGDAALRALRERRRRGRGRRQGQDGLSAPAAAPGSFRGHQTVLPQPHVRPGRTRGELSAD